MPGGESLKSFGYSLSGGLDLDANGYPDLLVGSYESGTISLLRSRAIIHLQAEVKVTPNKTDLSAAAFCPSDNSRHRCVELEICLTFTAEPAERWEGKHVCLCVCVCVCVCVCMHVCAHVHACVCVHEYYMCVFVWCEHMCVLQVCVGVCVCVHVCITYVCG